MKKITEFLKPTEEFKNKIEFSPSAHIYRVNGIVYPRSITETDLTFKWFFEEYVPRMILAKAIKRGHQLHKVMENTIEGKEPISPFNLGNISKATLDKKEVLEKNLMKCLKEKNLTPIACEIALAYRKYRMVGTMDLICINEEKKEITIVDLKSSKIPPADEFKLKFISQLTKYEFMIRKNFETADYKIKKEIAFIGEKIEFIPLE